VPRVLNRLKAKAASPPWARWVSHPAWSSTMARTKRTAQEPGTASHFLEEERSHGDPTKLSDAQHAGGRACCRPRRSVRIRGRSIARDDRSDGRRVEGAGGLRSSVDAGERVAPDPVEQLRPVLE
jgi:hypothetical protein